jgi:glycerol-3-phosphate dehydrogenase
MGAEIRVHDPYVDHWYELESQDTYPASGQSWKRFFRNQEILTKLKIEKDFSTAVKDIEAIIFAVPHSVYLNLEPEAIVEMAGGPIAVIDCYGMLTDARIRKYFELGCEVKALGRGHIQKIKKEVQKMRLQKL